MKKMKPVIFLAFLLFCFWIIARSSHASGPTPVPLVISEPTEWTKEGNPYIVGGTVTVKAPLTIEAGTIVKFRTGSIDNLKIQNDFYVNGTSEEKVIFTSIHDDTYGGDSDNGSSTKPREGDWVYLNFNPSQDHEMKIKYAVILYSSQGISLYPSTRQTKDIVIKNCEIRNNGTGIIVGSNAKVLIEKNVISENGQGIGVNSSKTSKAINNSIVKNGTGASGRNSSDPNAVSLEAVYNWWGDETGPYNEGKNSRGKGNPASGQISFNPWLKEDPIENPDPVIIIPGIMGSWEKDGKWQIDPIFHAYDNLCEEFLANGYENGKNFSVFPYQWRDSNIENAKILHKRIQDIKKETGRPKVDIVAHSMGGLLARQYIESDDYEDDVDQLITVGTPHLGAPKDYIKWEAGAFFADIFELAGKKFFEHEAKENGYDSIFHYIRGRIISVQELLPVYDYLWDDNGTDYDLRVGYPENYPRNEFLENLNNAEKVKKLGNVEFAKIIGKKNDSESTISGYNVVNASMGELWEHGYPHGFEIPIISDQGVKTTDGDITVPINSAESTQISSDQVIYLQSSHNNLPTDAQKDILEILTGKRPTSEVNEWRIDDILIGLVFSPVDFQIISPGGKRLGKNFETDGEYNEIEGAYYTGFGTDTEFLTIPNPEDGEYKILTEGTGTGGEYKIEIAKITKDPGDSDQAKESAVVIEGAVEPGQAQEAKIEVASDEVTYNPDTTPPDITIFSPEEKKYSNDNYALDFSFDIADGQSGVDESTVEKLLNGQPFAQEKLDLSLAGLGSYEYKISAKDKAGNSGSAAVVFQNTTNLDALQNNAGHYFELGFVKKKIARKYLNTRLKRLKKLFNLLEKTQNSKLKPKLKQAAVDALKKTINADISWIIRKIGRRTPSWFDQNAAGFLAESLEYLRIK